MVESHGYLVLVLWIVALYFLMPEVKIHSYMCLVISAENNDNESLIESINRFSKRL